MTTAGSGPPSRSAFAYFDPASCFWRTSQPTLFEELGTSSPTWPESGTWDLGFAYAHPMSELPTSASGCSSSLDPLMPTPRTSDTNGAGKHGDGGPDLRTVVSLLPTPKATDGTKGGPNQRGSKGDLALPSAVAHLLPTPMAADGHRTSTRMPNGNPTLRGALLPTSTATPYGNNQSPTPGAAVRPSLTALASSGALTDPPSAAGSPSSADRPQPLWTDADA